jgi:hypothetical protein
MKHEHSYNILLDIYPLLETFPPEESRSICERIRKIVTELAVKGTDAELVQELQTLLLMSKDLGFLEPDIHVFLERKVAELENI